MYDGNTPTQTKLSPHQPKTDTKIPSLYTQTLTTFTEI